MIENKRVLDMKTGIERQDFFVVDGCKKTIQLSYNEDGRYEIIVNDEVWAYTTDSKRAIDIYTILWEHIAEYKGMIQI